MIANSIIDHFKSDSKFDRSYNNDKSTSIDTLIEALHAGTIKQTLQIEESTEGEKL